MLYDRILIKVSGEALAGNGRSIDEEATLKIAKQLQDALQTGAKVAVVVGGGNFWRGRSSENMSRHIADQIGMLATVMNALALGDALRALGVPHKVYSAVTVDKVLSPYIIDEARDAFENNQIVIFGGGTGAPYFSTDTAAVLRACEIGANAVFCAKAVDGVYDSDPKVNPKAKKYDKLTYDKVIADNLKAMDLTSMAMGREYGLSMVIFGKDEPDGLQRILQGEKPGTVISVK